MTRPRPHFCKYARNGPIRNISDTSDPGILIQIKLPEQLFVVRSGNGSWWIWVLWPFGQSSQLGLSLILNLRKTVLWPATVSMRSVLFPTVLRVTLLCPPVHGGRGGGAVNFFSFSSTCRFGDASLSPADHMYRCRYMGTFPRVGLWSCDALMVFFMDQLIW